ncbi:hypothetical protein GCM10028791_33740 [Echinicola sediminis]
MAKKLTKKQFAAIQQKYSKEIREGKPGRGRKQHEIKDQTKWIWFDREEIEEVLSKADPKTGGIKFYFGEYDESFESTLGEDYVGRLMLAMVPANKDENGSIIETESLEVSDEDEDEDEDEGVIYNFGTVCPPHCS